MKHAPFIALLTWTLAAFAGDLSLELSDGRGVTLFENRTWEFQSKDATMPRSDIRIDMEDNRTLILRRNGTWLYDGERDTAAAPARPNIRQLQAMGMAKTQDPAAAVEAAKAEAIRRIAQSLRKSLKDPTLTDSSAVYCIRKCMVASLDMEKSFDNTGAVQVKITLEDERIQDVLDCLGR